MKTLNFISKLLLGFILVPLLVAQTTFSLANIDMNNKFEKLERVEMDKPVNELVDEIYENYGIKVHIGVIPETLENKLENIVFKNTHIYEYDEPDVKDYDAYFLLKALDEVLSTYDEETLEELPKHIFVVNNFYANIDGKKYTANAITSIASKPFSNEKYAKFITFNAENSGGYKATIEHEFMHCFEPHFTKEISQKIENLNLNCEDITAYACTNYSEMIAEAYAYGFIDRDLINK